MPAFRRKTRLRPTDRDAARSLRANFAAMADHESRSTTRRDMLLSSAGAVAPLALPPPPLNAQVATAAAAQQAVGTTLASLSDYEKAAKTKMTPMAWDYISGAAGDEITLAWNHDAYGDIKLRNKVLVDVSKIDT